MSKTLAEQILDKYYNDKAEEIMKDMIKTYDDVEGMYDNKGNLTGIKRKEVN